MWALFQIFSLRCSVSLIVLKTSHPYLAGTCVLEDAPSLCPSGACTLALKTRFAGSKGFQAPSLTNDAQMQGSCGPGCEEGQGPSESVPPALTSGQGRRP